MHSKASLPRGVIPRGFFLTASPRSKPSCSQPIAGDGEMWDCRPRPAGKLGGADRSARGGEAGGQSSTESAVSRLDWQRNLRECFVPELLHTPLASKSWHDRYLTHHIGHSPPFWIRPRLATCTRLESIGSAPLPARKFDAAIRSKASQAYTAGQQLRQGVRG